MHAAIYFVDVVDERHGLYYLTDAQQPELPEMLRRALLFTNGEQRREARLLSIIARLLSSPEQSIAGALTTSSDLLNTALPVIVCDLVSATVAFAVPGTETDATRWVAGKPFAEYLAQIRAPYPKLAIMLEAARRA